MESAMSDGALCRMLEVRVNIRLHFVHTVGGEHGWIFLQQVALMWCVPLLLQALVSCTRLTWLQVAGSLCYDGPSESKPNVSWTAVALCMLLCGGRCNLCTGRLGVTAASFMCIPSDRQGECEGDARLDI